MRRLFWLNVAAVVLFAGIAGYHYYRHRTRLVVGADALLAPIASASTEMEVRARGETLARMAHAARKEGGHLHRAMGWLALGAACMFLWSAVSISEFHEELAHLREEVVITRRRWLTWRRRLASTMRTRMRTTKSGCSM